MSIQNASPFSQALEPSMAEGAVSPPQTRQTGITPGQQKHWSFQVKKFLSICLGMDKETEIRRWGRLFVFVHYCAFELVFVNLPPVLPSTSAYWLGKVGLKRQREFGLLICSNPQWMTYSFGGSELTATSRCGWRKICGGLPASRANALLSWWT